jgi:hypothetical protein
MEKQPWPISKKVVLVYILTHFLNLLPATSSRKDEMSNT